MIIDIIEQVPPPPAVTLTAYATAPRNPANHKMCLKLRGLTLSRLRLVYVPVFLFVWVNLEGRGMSWTRSLERDWDGYHSLDHLDYSRVHLGA
jgi:hypothetical protein